MNQKSMTESFQVKIFVGDKNLLFPSLIDGIINIQSLIYMYPSIKKQDICII